MKGHIDHFSFRRLYRHCILLTDLSIKEKMEELGFPYHKGDNSVLAYTFVDHVRGINFAVLGFARTEPDGSFQIHRSNPEAHLILKYSDIKSPVIVVDSDVCLGSFQEKIMEIDRKYTPTLSLRYLRNYAKFDANRHPQYPDQILTVLRKHDMVEKVWVRVHKVGFRKYMGRLLNEPESEAFGFHAGDVVTLGSMVTEDGRVAYCRGR